MDVLERVEWLCGWLRGAKKLFSITFRWAPARLNGLKKLCCVLFGIHIFNPHCSTVIISERPGCVKEILTRY